MCAFTIQLLVVLALDSDQLAPISNARLHTVCQGDQGSLLQRTETACNYPLILSKLGKEQWPGICWCEFAGGHTWHDPIHLSCSSYLLLNSACEGLIDQRIRA